MIAVLNKYSWRACDKDKFIWL